MPVNRKIFGEGSLNPVIYVNKADREFIFSSEVGGVIFPGYGTAMVYTDNVGGPCRQVARFEPGRGIRKLLHVPCVGYIITVDRTRDICIIMRHEFTIREKDGRLYVMTMAIPRSTLKIDQRSKTHAPDQFTAAIDAAIKRSRYRGPQSEFMYKTTSNDKVIYICRVRE